MDREDISTSQVLGLVVGLTIFAIVCVVILRLVIRSRRDSSDREQRDPYSLISVWYAKSENYRQTH